MAARNALLGRHLVSVGERENLKQLVHERDAAIRSGTAEYPFQVYPTNDQVCVYVNVEGAALFRLYQVMKPRISKIRLQDEVRRPSAAWDRILRRLAYYEGADGNMGQTHEFNKIVDNAEG
eukprot:TRINITY_DN1825_c0_g1_i9.p1 TRINITY_DN1825_c0_g1~~TRINITY_DN1825_c0_g1_i9.p1  ORF type:complete len:121 (-),score=15.22 TRINITY_DN1825_c0_g1_i9:409-771(-)